MKTFKISKEEYGDQWPFNAEHVKVNNPKGTHELYVIFRGIKYNLNGMAKKGLPLEKIWLDNPDVPGTKKNIGFIFELCKKSGF